jgi:hypothetical protein
VKRFHRPWILLLILWGIFSGCVTGNVLTIPRGLSREAAPAPPGAGVAPAVAVLDFSWTAPPAGEIGRDFDHARSIVWTGDTGKQMADLVAGALAEKGIAAVRAAGEADVPGVVPARVWGHVEVFRVNVKRVVREAAYTTPVKTRILAGGVHSAKQQVVRIDRAAGTITSAVRQRVERALAIAIRDADVVIISDYGSGLVTPDLWRRVLARSRRTPPFVLVDSRYALAGFVGMTATTPNESEVEALLGMRIGDDRKRLESAGRSLLEKLQCQAVLITRGSRGMALFTPGNPTDHIAIVGSTR